MTRPLPTQSIYRAHKDKGESFYRNSCGRKLKLTENEAKNNNRNQKPYKCNFCDHWHLATKKPTEVVVTYVTKTMKDKAEQSYICQIKALKKRIAGQVNHIRGLEQKLQNLEPKEINIREVFEKWRSKQFVYEG